MSSTIRRSFALFILPAGSRGLVSFAIPILFRRIIDELVPQGRFEELAWITLGLVLVVALRGLFAYLEQSLTVGTLRLVNNAVFLGAGAGLLFWLNWKLASVATAVLPALALSSRILNRRLQVLSREIQEGDAQVSKELGEGLASTLTTKLLGLFPGWRGRSPRPSIVSSGRNRRKTHIPYGVR